MSGLELERSHGSFVAPRFEHAHVYDVMRHGVISCAPETSLQTVARMMSSYHVHAVVVTTGQDSGMPWGIVSDIDVLSAAAPSAEDLTAGEIAATDVLTVSPEEALTRTAQLMREHECTHVIVVDPSAGRPVGVVSTLDIAGALAWGEV